MCLAEEMESATSDKPSENPSIRVETSTTETDSANTTIEDSKSPAVDVSTNTERHEPRGRGT